MAEESKSGSSSRDGGGDAEQEEEASQGGGGGASRASQSGPPSVSFPLLTTRELLQQHVDAQLQQLEAGEIGELSLQTMWTMDVLFKSSPRGRQSAKTAVDAAAAAAATAGASVAAVTAAAPAATASAAASAAAAATAASAPTTAAAVATTSSTVAVAPNGAQQELRPPQTQTPDIRSGPNLRNLPSVMDTHVIRKKRSAPSAPVPRNTRPRQNTGRWTRGEHENFLEGTKTFGRNCCSVLLQCYVKTRTEEQIRLHAQKYFQEVDRSLSFPGKRCASANARANTGTSAQDGGNEDGGDNQYGSDNTPAAPARGGDFNHVIVLASTAAAGAGNAGYANRRIPAGGYADGASTFQAAPPPFSRTDQMAPVSTDFGANPLFGSGLPGSRFQSPSKVMEGVVGCGGAASEPGNGPQFRNRHAAGPGMADKAQQRSTTSMARTTAHPSLTVTGAGVLRQHGRDSVQVAPCTELPQVRGVARGWGNGASLSMDPTSHLW